MKKKMRRIAMWILFAVFTVSTAALLLQWKDDASGASAYEDALAVAMEKPVQAAPEQSVVPEAEQTRASHWVPVPVSDDPAMDAMAQLNLAALRAKNPDVVGWIRIPDTKIDYPLMQGEDNEFYLNHTWEKKPNSVGSIFLECQNNPGLTDYNTIVYGHNMNSGAMFAELEFFALKKTWQAHPYVYIATDAGVYRYEIFAFFQPEVDSLTYGMNPQRDDTKEKFLNLSLDKSWVDSGIRPAITDRILTLSTCSGSDYDYRYVLQARLPMMEVTQ